MLWIKRKPGHLFAIALAATLLAGQTLAVDFAFYYDDAAGQGFLDPVQGPARQAALRAAAEIWGRLILPSYAGETIGIRAKYDTYPAGSTTLASATPIYHYSDFGSSSPQYQSDTNYPKALANHLAGRDLAPERQEISISVNVAPPSPFYYDLDGMPGVGQRDFVTVAAHEIGHGLGFSDSFRDDGDFGILGDGTYEEPICLGCLPTPYDQFLTLGPGGPTLISLDGDGRESAVTSNNVFWNGTSGITGNGGTAPKIHAPATWSDTSSIAHLDATTFPMDLMRPNYYGVDQSPSAFERGMMRDMGWTISVASATANWTGLGADNNATTAANWSAALPLPGDSLAFDQSPQTDVQMDLLLGSLQGISFPATAPAYTLRFKSNVDIDLTGTGIINSSTSAQTIFLESGETYEYGGVTSNPAAALTFKNTANAGNADYHLSGGFTAIGGGPAPNFFFDRHAGASITFENNATAGTAAFNIEGGAGDGGPNAKVTFRNSATAGGGNAEIRTKGGRLGPSLPFGTVTSGFGGQIIFEDNSKAGTRKIHNEGEAEYYGGTGGSTNFYDMSDADHADIHNHGATYANAQGGATYFVDNSTAGSAMITNHADGSNYGSLAGARTIFRNNSNAGMATIENQGASGQPVRPGRTEFYDDSSAANATINSRGHITVGDLAGRTVFYDRSTAASATLRTFDGYSDHGRIEFHNQSTAASAHIFLENEPMNAASAGGYLSFYDDSTAAQSEITLRAGTCCFGGLQFYNNTTAANARIVQENVSGQIVFYGNSTAANATFSVGERTGIVFYDRTTAANAMFTLADRGFLHFSNNASAAQSQIVANGGSTYTASSGANINFISNTTADNATITVGGATAPLASAAYVSFSSGANLANATLTANGGSNGGVGARIVFNGAANGSTARVVANAGGLVDFMDQRLYGDISLGSIEGAGTFRLRGAHLTTGSRNTSTVVTGQIFDNPPGFVTGGRLTKVGTGILTLAGANTYTGATTINGGTLRVTGSLVGEAVVNDGGRLEDDGDNIAGGVRVNGNGVYAPGTSPGTSTIGGLTMMPGAILEFEIGDPLRDRIVLTNNGNVTLDGILKILLLDGFTPTLGQSFSLCEGAIGSITGAFDTIIAPTFNGLTFDVVQNAGSVLLQVGEATLLPGDFNGDGAIDATDYVVWRKTDGTSSSYNAWRANFGRVAGSSAASGAIAGLPSNAVPEPGSLALAAVTLIGFVLSPTVAGTRAVFGCRPKAANMHWATLSERSTIAIRSCPRPFQCWKSPRQSQPKDNRESSKLAGFQWMLTAVCSAETCLRRSSRPKLEPTICQPAPEAPTVG